MLVNYILITILISSLFLPNSILGMRASEFAAWYPDLWPPDKPTLSVKVVVAGEPQSEDPANRAKEIRYLQAGPIKFSIRAGAINVVSDTWNNEFTAQMPPKLIEALQQRSDVLYIELLEDLEDLGVNEKQKNKKIPEWVRNNASWWAVGVISDSDFLKAIEFLINENIIKMPTTEVTGEDSEGIPEWVRNNAGWWSEGQISDEDFLNGIQYLVKTGLIAIEN